jgi:hypothetical protein
MKAKPRRPFLLPVPALLLLLLAAACEENKTILQDGGGGPGPQDPGVDDGTDGDGDGLTDFVEQSGWEITVDEQGYGTDHLTVRSVASDASLADTDGDGLDDFEEYLIRSDPRLADSDHDQLDDLDEWTRWITNPVAVDSDGDARGPGGRSAPNAALFDGVELERSRTSPRWPTPMATGAPTGRSSTIRRAAPSWPRSPTSWSRSRAGRPCA